MSKIDVISPGSRQFKSGNCARRGPMPIRKTENIAKGDAASTEPRHAGEQRLQIGLYAYHRGDYAQALSHLEKACDFFSRSHQHEKFIESCSYLLRILAEREEFARIDRIEQRVINILVNVDLRPTLKSRVMYVLGICSCYQDTRHDQAMNRFREAIDFAVLGEDKSALAAPLYGAATVLYARQRYDEALVQLERLSVLLSCLSLPDVQSASLLLGSMIRRNQGLTDTALESAWAAFDSLKHNPHMVLYLNTLCVLGTLYTLKKDPTSARLYLDLAERTVKRDEFPRIARLIDDGLKSLGAFKAPEVDLKFDTRTGILHERIKGEIRFEGQFVLRDLLHLFMRSPGVVFSKSEIVDAVWKESYSPEVHDNKIYVTIKRLRKLLEAEGRSKDYILRAKGGYLLSPKVTIQIHDLATDQAISQKTASPKSRAIDQATDLLTDPATDLAIDTAGKSERGL